MPSLLETYQDTTYYDGLTIKRLEEKLTQARTLILAADVLIPALGELALTADSWRKDAKKFLEK